MALRTEIHCHSEYSNLRLYDAINRLPNLVDYAVELGLKGVALTDHETLAGAIQWKKQEKRIREKCPDFKCIIGNEIYLKENRETGGKYPHFILLAKDKEGFRQLRILSSIAWMNSYFDRRMERVVTTREDIEKIIGQNPGHVIASTACLAGTVNSNVLIMEKARKAGDDETAEKSKMEIIQFVLWCKKIFGEDFYLEVAPAANNEQIIVNKKVVELSKVFNVKIVIGCDAHYLKKEDADIHAAFLNSKGGERETKDFYEYAYLQSEEEIKENLTPSIVDLYEDMCATSMEIYNKIEDYYLDYPQQIPKVDVPFVEKGYYELQGVTKEKYPTLYSMGISDNNVERYWLELCINALVDKHLINKAEYLEELELEAKIKRIVGERLKTNMFYYPITLKHYIDLIWECGSPVGPGRGSAPTGLNHYLLGITQYDPLKYHQQFRRYMNEGTHELGDIDIDISPTRRGYIIDQIKKERGSKFYDGIDDLSRKNLGAALVATFGTASTKKAIQIACFKKGTLVQTKKGEKEIQNLSTGEEVWTVNGWEKILQPTHRLWKQNFVEIEGNYSFEDKIVCTDTHQFLVLPKINQHRLNGKINNEIINQLIPDYKNFNDNKKSKYRNYIRDIEPKWIEAKDLKEKDYLLTRIDTKVEDMEKISKNWGDRGNKIPNDIFINNSFCEWLGIWIAEGSINQSYVSFTISEKEEELKDRIIFLTKKVFDLDNVKVYHRTENHTFVLKIDSAPLRNFILDLYEEKTTDTLNQWTKKIPDKLKYIAPQKQLQIFKGWIMGDGYARKRENSEWSGSVEAKGTTVSRQLAIDMKFILHRNYINPSFCKVITPNKKPYYDIILSGAVAKKILDIKYTNFNKELIISWDDRLGKDLPCVYKNNLYMRSQVKTKNIIQNTKEQEVYCIMVPSETFSISGIIVHNCKGYCSEEYSDGIDIDTAQYISSLVPSERGFVWSLRDCYYGNPEKGRKPVQPFISAVDSYPGLFDIMLGLEGCVVSRSSHASGVIFMDEDPYQFGAFMRTPSGEIITQFDLHDCESIGMTKYDLLVTSAMDKISQAIQFLQEDNQIDSKLSLRQVYEKYLHPDVMNFEDEAVWKSIKDNNVLDLFQFDSIEGGKGIKSIQPDNLTELSNVNGLIRLVAPEGSDERPIEKYQRFKANPQLWYDEMKSYGLTAENVKTLEKYYKTSYGISISQENFLFSLGDKGVCGWDFSRCNDARRVISKKKMDKLPILKQEIINEAVTPELGKYYWDHVVLPISSYAFSDPHALAYAMVAYQMAYIATKWDSLYWTTACLVVNSESLQIEEDDDEEEDNPQKKKSRNCDYGRIASAIGRVKQNGIEVSPININTSDYGFKPDVKNHRILYGLKSLSNINEEIINLIKDGRPYVGIKDFMRRCPLQKKPMIILIKAGAFDEIETDLPTRKHIMAYYLYNVCEPKKKLNLQNWNGLVNAKLIPASLELQIRIYNFTKYLKAQCKVGQYYQFNDICMQFFDRFLPEVLDKIETLNGAFCMLQTSWEKIYKNYMDIAREWIKENQQQVLKNYNTFLFQEIWNKYALGTDAKWEMDSLCFYHSPHELANINTYSYGLADFNNLIDSEVDYYFKRSGRDIPIYKLHKIAGTVLDKTDNKSSITLLTTTGVVTVKFNREYYAMFKKQISQIQPNGKKKVLEKSWFTRGTKLVITGYKKDNIFIAKTYKSTPTHQLYIIDEVQGDRMIIRHERLTSQNTIEEDCD